MKRLPQCLLLFADLSREYMSTITKFIKDLEFENLIVSEATMKLNEGLNPEIQNELI